MSSTAAAEATIHLGEVFLETADGTKLSLGQLKAPFNISWAPISEAPKEAEPIQIGSKVKISDDPKCVEFDGGREGWVDESFAGKTGTVTTGPADNGDWRVEYNLDSQMISPEHLTVVA